jgi:hypothetical protein
MWRNENINRVEEGSLLLEIKLLKEYNRNGSSIQLEGGPVFQCRNEVFSIEQFAVVVDDWMPLSPV